MAKKQSKKILFVTSSSINGGAQKHIREMFRSLTKADNTVYMVAPKGWLTDELSEYQGRIFTFASAKEGCKMVSRVIEQFHPDIINTFILSGGVMGTAGWWKRSIGKLFVTVNNPVIYDGIAWYNKLIYPLLYRWMSRYASAFLVKSDAVRDEVKRVVSSRKPVLSIKNGIDFTVFDRKAQYANLRRQLDMGDNDIIVSNVAVLNERKGQKHIIEAMAMLRKKYPVKLVIAGNGPARNELENEARQQKVDDIVYFLGSRSDVNCVLANSDIFVLSSYHEGLPNSLMEAMAMGLPCVATDVGGVRQLIDDHKNGIIIQTKSSDAIADSIVSLVENPKLMKTLGDNAFVKMRDHFAQEKVVEELEMIYERY